MTSATSIRAVALLVAVAAPGCREHAQPPAAAAKAGAARDAQPAGKPRLRISDVSFAGPSGHRPGANFARGERVLCLFTLANFTYENRRADIVADLRVNGSTSGALVLEEEGLAVLAGKAPTLRPGQVRSMARLNITPATPAGRYTVTIEALDRLSGRRSKRAAADFTILGTPRQPAARLVIDGLRHAADEAMPAGSVAPIAFEVRGFKTLRSGAARKRSPAGAKRAERHVIDLGVEAQLRDAAGRVAHRRDEETLLRTGLLFEPPAYPVEYALDLPRGLGAGRYRLGLTIRDRIGNQRVTAELPLQIVRAGRLGIYNVHLHDAAHLPRRSFRLGEQAYVRLSVQGFAVRQGQCRVEVDVGIAGPQGGVYFARKNVSPLDQRTAPAVARAGRRPIQLPLLMPTLAPVGRYRLVIRARDGLARRAANREVEFHLTGATAPPLETFTIDQLKVRLRPDLPTTEGDAFFEGRDYHLELRVGGAKLKKVKRMTFKADIEATVVLRDRQGKEVSKQTPFRLVRTLHHRPLRILIAGKWTVPAGLQPGLYTFEVHALNKVDQMVSQMTRRVAIFSQGRVASVPLP